MVAALRVRQSAVPRPTTTISFAAVSDPKLPSVKAAKRRSNRNEWVAQDRQERVKAIAAVIVGAMVLGAGAWLLFHGLRQ